MDNNKEVEAAIIAHWRRQMEETVFPYLCQAVKDGHGIQVVLFLHHNGKVGKPKVSITT